MKKAWSKAKLWEQSGSVVHAEDQASILLEPKFPTLWGLGHFRQYSLPGERGTTREVLLEVLSNFETASAKLQDTLLGVSAKVILICPHLIRGGGKGRKRTRRRRTKTSRKRRKTSRKRRRRRRKRTGRKTSRKRRRRKANRKRRRRKANRKRRRTRRRRTRRKTSRKRMRRKANRKRTRRRL